MAYSLSNQKHGRLSGQCLEHRISTNPTTWLECAGHRSQIDPRPSANANAVRADRPFGLRLAHAVTPEENEAAVADLLYYPTADGIAAAKASWERIHERQEDRSDFLGKEWTSQQITAFQYWSSPNPTNPFERLHELKMPVFVANGDKDVLVDTSNTWEPFQKIEGARLVLYPAAQHGSLNQYAETFGGHVNDFLG
ncbi:hypothetical protein N7G274_004518 [Stereocaulon virgatum]|uniref:Uncharacterized protein n=1 Tax=Stereocaulon virgatum TaxID=373712 RepID=A0ABR4ABA3_9LECA